MNFPGELAGELVPVNQDFCPGDLGLHLAKENLEAIDTMEKAIAEMPESIMPRLWLAKTLGESGRLKAATTFSKAVLDLDPEFSASIWADGYNSKTHKDLREKPADIRISSLDIRQSPGFSAGGHY